MDERYLARRDGTGVVHRWVPGDGDTLCGLFEEKAPSSSAYKIYKTWKCLWKACEECGEVEFGAHVKRIVDSGLVNAKFDYDAHGIQRRIVHKERKGSTPRRGSFVYFIQAASGPIKIGTSFDPVNRLADLQTGMYEELSIIGLSMGDEKEESRLHRQFADDNLRGEWFSPSAELLEYIADCNEAIVRSPVITGRGNVITAKFRKQRR